MTTKLKTGNIADHAVTPIKADLSQAWAFTAVPSSSAPPASANDLVNKAYADGISAGLDPKASVRAIATANITLSAPQTIDGVAVIAGDRVLVAGQTLGQNNGIYVAAAGAWARSADADTSGEVTGGMYCFVTEGTTYHDTGWVLTTNDPIILGTTVLTFSQFTGASSPPASESTAGIAELATQTETNTGTDDLRIVTPLKLANATTVLHPSAIGSTVEAWDADLDALAALSGTGLAARTGSGAWASRTLQPPAAGLTIANPGGVAGDPTFSLANDLASLEAMSGTGLVSRTGSETYAQRTLQAPVAGLTISNPAGIAGDPTFALANDLGAVEGLSSNGLAARTGTDTWTTRTITPPAAGIGITNGDGVAGNPTLALANDLAGLEAMSGTGLVARTASETYAQRTITPPAAGIGVTNGDGVSGNPTLALANDLAALEALSTTGVPIRTGTDTWALKDVRSTPKVYPEGTNTAMYAGNVVYDYFDPPWDGAVVKQVEITPLSGLTTSSGGSYKLTIDKIPWAGSDTATTLLASGTDYTLQGNQTNKTTKIFDSLLAASAATRTPATGGSVRIGLNSDQRSDLSGGTGEKVTVVWSAS